MLTDFDRDACQAQRRYPHLPGEPVPRDVPIGVQRPQPPRRPVFTFGAPGGSVLGVCASTVAAAALSHVVGGDRAVPVSPASSGGLGESQVLRFGYYSQSSLEWLLAHGEKQIAGSQGKGLDVFLELLRNLLAQLQPTALLVLRVVLDEEAAAVRMEFRHKLDDRAANCQDAGGEVDILRP